MATCPLKNFSWVIPGILAGSAVPPVPSRTTEGEEPSDNNNSNTKATYDWIAANFKTVVNLREETDDEIVDALRAAGVPNTVHLPVVDRAVPTPEQFDRMAQLVLDSSNWPILARCKAGIGRTAYFLCAGFIALFLRKDEEPGLIGVDVDSLKRILFSSPSNNNSNNSNRSSNNVEAPPQRLTGASLISHLKKYREVNISETAVDDLITRWRLSSWALTHNKQCHLSSSSASAQQHRPPPRSVCNLDNFRFVIHGVIAACSFPSPSWTGDEFVTALRRQANFKCVINLETKPYTPEQHDALKRNGIKCVSIPVVSGGSPTMAQLHQIAELVLDRASNWPILGHCGGGRGRIGTAIACGIAALRYAKDPQVSAVGKSTNDIMLFVRTHLGPIAVENLDQEKILSRFITSLHLSNYVSVVPGVLSYCATPSQHNLQHPLSVWLAVNSAGAFSSVVFLSPPEDEALLSRAKEVLCSKGIACFQIPCQEGHAPSAANIEKFVSQVVTDARNWPILMMSSNGFARCVTMSSIALISLSRSQTLKEKFFSGKSESFWNRIMYPSPSSKSNNNKGSSSGTADNGGGGESMKLLIKHRERVHVERCGTPLSILTVVQQNAVERFFSSSSVPAAATSSSSTASAEGEDTHVVKFIAFGDFGAPLDSQRLQDELRRFAAGLANEVATNGRPDYILALGDNFYWNGVWKQQKDPMFRMWRQVFLEEHAALRGIPWRLVAGNHDLRGASAFGNPDTFQYQMDYTNLGEDENPGGVWQFRGNDPKEPVADTYSFVHPFTPETKSTTQNFPATATSLGDSVFFAALDTNVSQSRCRRDVASLIDRWPGRRAWLEKQLEGAQRCLWRITYSHQPVYTSGLGHDPEGQFLRDGMTLEDGTMLQPLEPILNDNNVDLNICGHEHELWCKVRGPKDVLHVVSGATMEWARYGATNPTGINLHRTDWEADHGTTGFVRVTITKNEVARSTRMLVEFVRASDLVVMHRVSKVKSLDDIIPSAASATSATSATGTSDVGVAETQEGGGSDNDADAGMGTPTSSSILSRSESQQLFDATSSKPAIIIINHPTMLETLAGMVESLRRVADVFCFTSTKAAMEATKVLLRRRMPIAALVTNMRRRREFSGIHCLKTFATLCQQAALPYFVPAIMFSHHGAKRHAQISFDAGAFSVFHTSVEKLTSQLLAVVETGRWAKLRATIQSHAASMFAHSSSAAAAAAVAKDVAGAAASSAQPTKTSTTDELRFSHCLRPLPAEAGGIVKSATAQQLIFTVLCAAYEKLSKIMSKAVVEEANKMGLDESSYCLRGESALSFWAQCAGVDTEDQRGRTATMEIAVLSESDDVMRSLASRIQMCVQSSADIIKAYLAHCSLRTAVQQSSSSSSSSSSSDFVTVNDQCGGDGANNNNKQMSVEVQMYPIGGLALNKTSSGNEDDSAAPPMMRWTVARIFCPPQASASLPSSSSSSSSSSAAAAASAGQASSNAPASSAAALPKPKNAIEETGCTFSHVVETGPGTRLCPGLLVLTPEATLKDLTLSAKASSSSTEMQYYAHRAELLRRYMEEILPLVR